MTIGIDASRANRKIKTGTEWYSYYLIQELKKITKQSEVRFFLYTDKFLRDELAKMPKNWQEKVLVWPPKFLWTQARFSLEMLFKPVDVLFVPAHAIPLIHPQNTITVIHDLGFERFPETYSPWQRFYYRFVHRLAVSQAKKIIVPSEFTKKELVFLYNAKPEKIEVIPMACDNKLFRLIEDQNRVEQVLKKYKIKKPYLLYVGRIELKKGIKCLLKAYQLIITSEKLQDLSLVLVGQPGYDYKNIKPKIKDPKSKIHFLGYMASREELVCFYSGAEAFVFPSLYEGFGLPLLEALACGRPVIASNIEPLKEVGGEAVNFFRLGDSEDLARRIKEILEDHDLQQKMISTGLQHIKNFSWRNCAEKTLKVLLSCGRI